MPGSNARSMEMYTCRSSSPSEFTTSRAQLPALVGAATAVGGVIYAIWKSSDVLLPAVATLDEVKAATTGGELARFRDNVLGGKDGLFRRWGGTVDGIRAQRELEYATLAAIDAYTPAEPDRAAVAQARSDVVARIEQLNDAVDVALAGAGYATARDLAFERRRGIAEAAVAVAVGVGLFTWAVNRPDGDETPTVESSAARPAAVTLNATGRVAFAELLGSKCAEPAPAPVLNGDTDGPWEVVTTGDGACRPGRFELTAEQGEPVYIEVARVTVTLTDAGRQRLAPVLGADCAAAPFAALDLGGDDRHQLLALAEGDCRAARFTLGADEGTRE